MEALDSLRPDYTSARVYALALVAAAAANRTLNVASEAEEERKHGPRYARVDGPSDEWEGWLREFHRLLVRIAVKHAEIVSWSISVGTDFSLTVNFASRKARAEHDSGFPGPGS